MASPLRLPNSSPQNSSRLLAAARSLRFDPALVAGALACGLALALNAWTYFALMPADREVWTAFYPLHTRIGEYVRALADAQGPQAVQQVFVSDKLAGNEVFGYLTYHLPVQTFSRRLTARAQSGAQFVVAGSTSQADLRALIERNGLDPTPLAVGPLLPDGSTPAFVVYRKK